MLIVAIDTSGRNGSVALCRGDATGYEVIGLAALQGGTYSARLVPRIAELLDGSQFTKSQVEGLVVVDGPGSFTGLRVGIATVKALCEARRKPLAVVSMLEALAVTYGHNGEVVTAVLDAGRGEVYQGEYEIVSQLAELRQQSILKLTDCSDQLSAAKSRVVTTFSQAAGVLAAAEVDVDLVKPLQADAIGYIGLRKLLAGETADPATLDANYIRRSDAELFFPPKH